MSNDPAQMRDSRKNKPISIKRTGSAHVTKNYIEIKLPKLRDIFK